MKGAALGGSDAASLASGSAHSARPAEAPREAEAGAKGHFGDNSPKANWTGCGADDPGGASASGASQAETLRARRREAPTPRA